MVSRVDGWVFANFRFWANGVAIGDFNEHVDLKGCAGFLNEFITSDNERFDASLVGRSKEEIFDCVYDRVVVTSNPGESIKEAISRTANASEDSSAHLVEDARNRFHLDHVGMSSFADHVSIVLVDNGDGMGRLVWRDLTTMQLNEAWFPVEAFSGASKEFLSWARSHL